MIARSERLAASLLPILLASLAPISAWSETVTVATLNWPPYTSADLPLGGATTEVVRQAFAKAGIQTRVSYLPWKRAIESAKDDAGVVAYYPGYHCHHVPGFVTSDPIGNGPLGFAEKVSHPVTWTSIADLVGQKLKIGTVLGYANTDEFDATVKAGLLHTVPAPDDATNLRKLAYGRIDVAVIDKLVMSYLLATNPSLKGDDKVLEFNSRPLAKKTLYICFNDTKNGRALRDRFDKGLAQVDVADIVDRYFKEQF